MVNGKEMKNHETLWKTTRNHENTSEKIPKVVKYNDIKKHCQQWLSPNKGISSDGNENGWIHRQIAVESQYPTQYSPVHRSIVYYSPPKPNLA